ncbi:hypothetical protein BsWGS_26625 [Bradybaena similaris]
MITSSNTTSSFNLSGFSNVTSDVEELLLQEKRYEFSWDYKTRGLLLTSIFFTSFLAPLLANAIRGYLGNKTTLVVLTLTLAGLNFLSPVTARANVYIFLAVRVLMGLVINSHMPIAGDMMAWWLPVSEKLTAVSFVMGGWYLGGFIAPIIAGYLCALPVDGGWPLAYYFAGAVTVPWSIAIIFLTSRKPEKHPFISDKEKAYIIRTRLGLSQNSTSTQKADRPPYRSIFSSIPVISFTAAEVAHVFNVCIVLACTPTYLASVLRLSIQEAGLVMGVTWAFRFPASQLWTVLGNWLMRFESVGTNGTRKICFGLGQAVAGVFALGIAFCDEQKKWLASGLLLISSAASTFGTSMLALVPLDMAPRYAGFITSLSSSVVFLVSFTGPMFASTVTPKGSFEEWQLVWITMAVVYLASGLLFTVFGSASLQSWAVPSIEITAAAVEPANARMSQNDSKSFNKSSESLH